MENEVKNVQELKLMEVTTLCLCLNIYGYFYLNFFKLWQKTHDVKFTLFATFKCVVQ